MTESLLERTQKLLKERGDLSLRAISDGSGVGYEWLRKLVYAGIENPSVVRIEKVYSFLSDYQAAKRFNDSGRAA